MRILMDLTYITSDVAGVTNYSYRLLSGFKDCGFQNKIILLCTSENEDIIKKHASGFSCVVLNLKQIRRIPHFRGWLNKSRLNKIVKAEQIDVFFSPYIVFTGLYTGIVPFVGVLHDAQGFSLKTSKLKQWAYDVFTKHILKKVSMLVTISQFAKHDILEKVPNLKAPISVIYNSVDVVECSKKVERQDTPYILNVNTLEPYKNLITLVKAFDLVKEQIPHNLYVKAKKLPYWDRVIEPYLVEHDLQDRVCLIDICYTGEEMDRLYSNAALFVSPSLMEGFGFTPIEAALHEIPVVCSKETALYETTMGLLNYYEPATDELALSHVILSVLAGEHADLSAIAAKFRDVYSPVRQAKSFISIFEKIAER